MISVATHKFISDIAHDAHEVWKIRQHGAKRDGNGVSINLLLRQRPFGFILFAVVERKGYTYDGRPC
jgi:hypothetical protein